MLGKQFIKGRNMDKTLESTLKSFDKDGTQEDDKVKLQYFDKKGRKLTIKEAYRQMCWKFHGRMPSHRKREKMAKKEEIQNKISQQQNSLGSLMSAPLKSSLGSLGSLTGVTVNQKQKKEKKSTN